ncbi:hypothetical protein AAZX31_06G206100 [Glycine max]|uniref:Phytocyanin domain-containing protein n=3 Tax=Glycine subgen. Soja TaxID=1462606 RepID=I1KDD0_SOYBN|nr:umecyanin [Glycine max]XP_028234247.1 umecyanin-like [Glycine soja]KAG5032452.1 hypothetical protein JHK85_016434 [Glycine max]KAG5046655.1 hypothetical protein JHK86_016061 [Glycine max]KAG5149153.1 hypothetical protein JHK82_016034 [Glycine max]KAH1127057.1 hypothetical protein GYH30_015876 [Glycine max]KAH1246840.1 Blue copper protein [Glycine max]|eukprot:XP_003527167.1 umecyanin [Glycine max]
MARKVGLNFIGCSIVAMVFIIGVAEATDYIVGEGFGWSVPSNESFYTDWASTKRFFVGDNLIFNISGEHSVGIRTEATYYENCNTSLLTGFTFIGVNGSNSMFRHNIIPPTGPRYFLCTVGNHCERGQKFSISVESHPDSAAPTTLSFRILSAFLSSLAVYFFTVTS